MVKSYIYKAYRNGVFMGVLQNVTSEFGIVQDINAGGSSIRITVGERVDTSGLAVEQLLDESGVPLQDESNNDLTEEQRPDTFGPNNELAKLNNGNQIIVWEYSDYWPNGKVMFNGIIVKVEGVFKGDDTAENITATCYSFGLMLDDLILQDV